MVALLWAEGNAEAAIEVERLWNILGEKHTLSLLCGYPMQGFRAQAHVEPFLRICGEHSQVIPGESFAAIESPEDRGREIAALQQKANSLATEVEYRRKVESALARRQLSSAKGSFVATNAACRDSFRGASHTPAS